MSKYETLKIDVTEFDESISALESQMKPYQETVRFILGRITEIKEAKDNYIVENKLYLPLDILKEHIGRSVSSICFYLEDGETCDYYSDEGIDKIGEDGHFEHSSYIGGVMSWEDEDKCYNEYYHYRKTPRRFIGIKEVTFADERSERYFAESRGDR